MYGSYVESFQSTIGDNPLDVIAIAEKPSESNTVALDPTVMIVDCFNLKTWELKINSTHSILIPCLYSFWMMDRAWRSR